jgi:hypothetical protein
MAGTVHGQLKVCMTMAVCNLYISARITILAYSKTKARGARVRDAGGALSQHVRARARTLRLSMHAPQPRAATTRPNATAPSEASQPRCS